MAYESTFAIVFRNFKHIIGWVNPYCWTNGSLEWICNNQQMISTHPPSPKQRFQICWMSDLKQIKWILYVRIIIFNLYIINIFMRAWMLNVRTEAQHLGAGPVSHRGIIDTHRNLPQPNLRAASKVWHYSLFLYLILFQYLYLIYLQWNLFMFTTSPITHKLVTSKCSQYSTTIGRSVDLYGRRGKGLDYLAKKTKYTSIVSIHFQMDSTCLEEYFFINISLFGSIFEVRYVNV